MIKKLLLVFSIVVVTASWGNRGEAHGAASLITAPLFTTASLNGTCGFNTASTDVDPIDANFLKPISTVGTVAFNGAGSVTMAFSENTSGTLTSGTWTGSYSVGSDGITGTMNFTAAGGPLLTFVVTSNGLELRFINTGPVDLSLGITHTVDIGVCKF